jgi:hypothetical protein
VRRSGSPSGGGARDQKPPRTAGLPSCPSASGPYDSLSIPSSPGMPGSAVGCSAPGRPLPRGPLGDRPTGRCGVTGRGAVRMGLAIGSRPYVRPCVVPIRTHRTQQRAAPPVVPPRPLASVLLSRSRVLFTARPRARAEDGRRRGRASRAPSPRAGHW